MSGCKNVTSLSLAHKQKLKKLAINEMRNLTTIEFSKENRCMEEIHIAWCAKIKDKMIEQIIGQVGIYLKTLKIRLLFYK